MEKNSIVVLDNGSGYLKAGFSNQSIPTFNIPALVGRPMLRYEEHIENFELKPIMIGDQVIPVRSMLEIKHPMKEGIIDDKEDMELLWRYCLNEKMGIDPSEFRNLKVMLTEAPHNPLFNKETIAQIMFEKMGVGYFNIEPQAKLSLICEGLQSGIVLDSGDGVTHCIPIYCNSILPHYIKRLNIAGRHITDYLIRLLQVKGYAFNSTADFETVRDLKEKFCFLSCDLAGDRKLDIETTFYNSFYKLPDNRVIKISKEKFEAPEILFKPYLIQSESPGVHELIFNSINV
jgi:actin-related protein 2